MAPRRPMMATTIMSSTRVKPRLVPQACPPVARIPSRVHDVGVLAVAAGLAVGAVALHVVAVLLRLPRVEVDALVVPGILEGPVPVRLEDALLEEHAEPLLGGRVPALQHLAGVDAVGDL